LYITILITFWNNVLIMQ